MKNSALLTTIFSVVLVLVLTFVGGAGPGLRTSAVADAGTTAPALATTPIPGAASVPAAPRISIASTTRPIEAAPPLDQSAVDQATVDQAGVVQATVNQPAVGQPAIKPAAASVAALSQGWEHLAQKPVPKSVPVISGTGTVNSGGVAPAPGCPGNAGGTVGSAPGIASAKGVAGTTSSDLASFAIQYNAIRIAQCLQPISYSNFRYDSCMEARLFWMAESPSPSPLDAWGHIGSVRIDGVPSNGCDGNLAGGSGNTGATVAQKWWNSTSHRASLYRPGSSTAGACIAFAMSHGGVDEPASFVRSAARWTTC
jgi:hypothetical protein